MKPHVGAAGRLAHDLVRALVHDLEAHMLEHRNALGERNGSDIAPYLQGHDTSRIAGAAMEIDRKRATGGQPLDTADVRDGVKRRVGLAIALGERIPVALQ